MMNSIVGQILSIDSRQALYFAKMAFYVCDLKSGASDLIVHVPTSGWKRILCYCRLFSRLLRMEPRCVEKLIDGRFVVCYAHKVWLLDVDKRTFTVLQKSRDGFSNPLNLCSDGTFVYWGDYGNNLKREMVNIYRIGPELKVEIVHSFPMGTMRHIHNVVWDMKHQRFYVLSGDMENTSGIYLANKDWTEVKPLLTGKQQYRAVVGFPYKDGLIYATDSVEEENHIYLLRNGDVRTICSLMGSCIYGTENKNYYVFSSTVEPSEGRGLLKMFSYKLGTGIRDRYTHLVIVSKEDLKTKEVAKFKKDIWPMKLFQYGAIKFPKGQERSEELWCYIMACKGDGKSIRVNC